jgi:hypothetical protein
LIQKILASPNVEQPQKHILAEKVKSVLSKLSPQNMQGCKRLLEEVNLIIGGDSSTTESAKLTPGGYVPAEYTASAANFYTAMASSQHPIQQLALPTDTATGTDSASEGQESNPTTTSTAAPLNANGGHMTPTSMPHAAGGFPIQHSPYYAVPHGQLYGHYPSPFYSPGTTFVAQPMTTMGYPGIMPQTGFNPYIAMPPPGIGGGLHGDGSQLNGPALFLQQQHQQQQLYHLQQHQQQQQQQQFQQQQ